MTAGPATTRRPNDWWRIAWYPLAVPVAFIVLIWSATGIHPAWLLRPLVATIVLVLLLTVGLSALLRDRDRGALAASAVVVALVAHDLRLTALLLVIACLIVAEGFLNRRLPWRRGPTVTRLLSAFGGALLVATVASMAPGGSLQEAAADVLGDLSRPAAAASFDPDAPDIYIVVLDGYPGDDAAELDKSFDAEAFPVGLQGLGFEVQRHSRSNYLLTRLTFATMFGGDHIAASEALRPPYGSLTDDSQRLRRFGDAGPALRVLAGAGYETATIASDASHLGLHRVDRTIDPPSINEFEGALLRASGAGVLLEQFFNGALLDMRRSALLATFDAAEGVGPSGARPLFEVVHIMAPHPPLLFDANGAPAYGLPALTWQDPAPGPEARADRIRGTLDYATFVSRRTLSLVERLIERDPAGVVIVMSDHGTDSGFDPTDPAGSDLDERSSNLLAIRSPGRPHLLPPGTTPINILPRVLNAYLGASLPIRSDTTWAYPTGGSVLDAVPVDATAFGR